MAHVENSFLVKMLIVSMTMGNGIDVQCQVTAAKKNLRRAQYERFSPFWEEKKNDGVFFSQHSLFPDDPERPVLEHSRPRPQQVERGRRHRTDSTALEGVDAQLVDDANADLCTS